MRVITGKAKGVHLKSPQGMATRPTAERVKEALFSVIQFHIPCASVLDLFGGSGQLGIEALSRNASKAVFVDEKADACNLIRENLRRTKLDGLAKVVHSDYANFLRNCSEKFDIIFLDPPYAEVILENSLKLITEIDILQSGGIIVTERPVEKELSCVFPGYVRSKDYKYGNTLVTIYRKDSSVEKDCYEDCHISGQL